MSNIYLKVTIEKNWRSRNFDFLSLKNLPTGQFLRRSNSRRYFKTSCCNLKITGLGAWLSYYYNFERNYDVLKSNNSYILLNKSKNFNKTKRNRKWKIPHTVLERQNLCFSSYKNRKLIVNLWWVGARERKKRA